MKKSILNFSNLPSLPPLELDFHKKIRIGHVLSCFFLGHTYKRLSLRQFHREYLCVHCGHPLLFKIERDPYFGKQRFVKKVRYLCNLLGHQVHAVGERSGFMEYACHCGHSFLKEEKELKVVKHPSVCTLLGHYIKLFEKRDGIFEYRCCNCGHTFCFNRELDEK